MGKVNEEKSWGSSSLEKVRHPKTSSMGKVGQSKKFINGKFVHVRGKFVNGKRPSMESS